jgi:hypothetical protein
MRPAGAFRHRGAALVGDLLGMDSLDANAAVASMPVACRPWRALARR